MKCTTLIVAPLLSILTLLGVVADASAQKPAAPRQLEIVPSESESSYRFQNMRVSRETGAPVALYSVNYAVTPSTPLNMATQYLQENSALLRMQPDISDLQHSSTRETPGGYHVRFRQHVDGYPMYGGDIVVNINRQNMVTFVMSDYKPLVDLGVSTPSLSLAAAERIADGYLNVQGTIRHRDRATVVYLHNSVARLVHEITIVPAEDMFGDWEILVDAVTGEILRAENKAVHATTDGSGWVFDPDPLTHARATYQTGGQFGDNNDADTDSLTAHIVQRTLPDIEFDGMYHLRGPYAQIVDSEAPFNGVYSRADSVWHFTRNPADFEAANVYFHIDQSMRYINETLGFSLMPTQYSGGVKGDPHGLGGDDNSHYISSTGELAWGEGGVDDAEDADVILHELGHGLHDWLTNGNLSQVNGLSEGCGDYWTNSYNRSLGHWTPSDPQYYWVFQWDGHNEYWGGRVTNYAATYPGGLVGQVHTDGQMWSSTLMQIWEDIGRTATDLNFLEALSMTNSSTNQEDAAQAFVQADLNLHGGANLSSIEFWFTQRGYNITVPVPSITHTPLPDSEDLLGPYAVSADIVASSPLDVVRLIYGTGGAFTDTLDMVLQSGDTYTAAIPGTGVPTDYNYYIFAADNGGLASTSPGGAPGNYHAFQTGADVAPPVIVHTPLGNQAYIQWPAVVQATITDNLGIDSSWVEYSVNNGAITGSFDLVNTSGDVYSGAFDIDTTMVAIGDSVEYRIVARDVAVAGNQTLHPASGYHMFDIIGVLGVILIIDDDPSSSSPIVKSDKGEHTRDLQKTPYGKSAGDMETYLLDAGYSVVVETPAATNPATWDSYDLLISSSGINESSLSNLTYRNALIAHAQAGKKYLLEGGEVGWTWRNNATIMSDVLHSSGWNGDNVGALLLIGGQATHPIATTPNALPGSIGITYTAYGSEDAMTPTDSYVIYEPTADPGDAGVSVYDQDLDPTTAQNVYFAFNFGQVTSATVARELLENTVDYLLQPEPDTTPPVVTVTSPNGGESWNVGDSNDITWTATDAGGVDSVSIYYSTDGGVTFPFTIATGEANDSVYPWIVSSTVTDSAVVRVVAYDASLNQAQDESDSLFTIATESTPPAVTVTSPNGGETWNVGSAQTITWLATDASGVDSVSIFYSVNGGSTYDLVASGEPNDSSYPWIVPATPTDSALVRVVAYDAALNTGEDVSDSLFTIADVDTVPPVVAVTAPTGGESWIIGDTQDITWTATDASGVDSVSLYYSVDGGQSFIEIASGEANDSAYSWTIPNAPSDSALVWIVAYDPFLNTGEATSDSLFMIGEILGVPGDGTVGAKAILPQSVPNPFTARTVISFSLPEAAVVSLAVYDVKGRRIATLMDQEELGVAQHQVVWNGVDDNGVKVGSGVYFYQLRAGDVRLSRKLLVVR